MKNLFSIFALAFFCFFITDNIYAQDGDTEYVVAEYMKVKPGMWDKYLECEKAWKTVHEARKKAGSITGWELEEVLFPSGTDTEYDFLVLTHYKNWEAINAEDWGSMSAHVDALPADKKEIANNAAQYRDIVKREIWSAVDMVFGEGTSRPKFAVENYMRIPIGGWADWIEMETEFVKPVHVKSIEMGFRAGWLVGNLILPRGADYPYQGSTIDYYNSWEEMNKSDQAAWDAVYPGMTNTLSSGRIVGTRTLARTEVRELIDFIE